MNTEMQTPATPAARVIKAFGGVRETARVLDISSSTVSRWQKPREEGGTGGRVPTKHQAKVLEHSAAKGFGLTADQLIA